MEADTLEQRVDAALGVLERVKGVRAVHLELRRVTVPDVVLGGTRGELVPWSDVLAIVSQGAAWTEAAIYAGPDVVLVTRTLTVSGEVTVGLLIPRRHPGTKSMRRSVRLALLYLDPSKRRLHAPPKEPRRLPASTRPRKRRTEQIDPLSIEIPKFL